MSNDLIDMKKSSRSLNRKLWLLIFLSIMSLLSNIWFTLHPANRESNINQDKNYCHCMKTENCNSN
ncbi:hypothetical protein Lsha_1103 [Legionella shakespearei DSM 23087]|uniref:Uncharacterized protein n=1 Tax=Legionella shakespearei DSM 23087 TaxID=1122169 RepID=A0A0W0Z0Q3_9GAMM|nr:hypothetical protein Lsha_1103 [Legionella shakespearei DSM 23087]